MIIKYLLSGSVAFLLLACAGSVKEEGAVRAVNEALPMTIEDQPTDWPQWRGAERDGLAQFSPINTTWPEKGLSRLWKKTLGDGFSAVSIWNKRAYTQYSNGYDEILICMNAATGKTLWKARLGASFLSSMGGDGPRSTPTVSQGVVYTMSAFGTVAAHDALTGEDIWRIDLRKDHDGDVPDWGYATCALLHENMLIIEAGSKSGGLFMALNRTDGSIIWQSGTGKGAYSSPILATIGGENHIIFLTGKDVRGIRLEDGKQLWQTPFPTSYDNNIATPILFDKNKIYVSAGYGTGAMVFAVEQQGGIYTAQEIWRNKVMKNHMSTAVFADGYLYGFDNSILKCIDANTGEEVWKTRGYGKGTLLMADGHLIILGEKGKLGIAPISSNGFQEKAAFKAISGRCWTMPSIADGRIYVRSRFEMACYDIDGRTSAEVR